MKYFIQVLLLFVIPINLIAQVITYNQIQYYRSSKTGVSVHQQSVGKELHIPAFIVHEKETLNVEGIEYYAFQDQKIEKIILPKTIKIIHKGAFHSCKNLISINFPESLEKIEEKAFYACTSLESVEISGNIENIETGVFQNCTKLKSAQLKGNLNTLSYELFSGCKQLQSLQLPKSLKTISLRAFENCHQLTTIKLPQNLENIYNYAFLNCNNLTTIQIPAQVNKIGDGVFVGCDLLTSISVDRKNNFYSSLDGVLYDKNQKTIVAVPAGKEKIDIAKSTVNINPYAFNECKKLKSINLPDSVSFIPHNAFSGCSQLSIIQLSANIKKVSYASFSRCKNIQKISVSPNNCCYTTIEGVLFSKDTTTLIFCPPMKAEFTIPENVTKIESNAFEACTKIDSIRIPKSVRIIGNFAFRGCVRLQKIVLMPPNPPNIGISSFLSIARNAVFYVPKENLTAYKQSNTLDWKEKNYQTIN